MYPILPGNAIIVLEQLRDILPSLLLAVLAGGCAGLVDLLPLPDLVTLVLQILLGLALYVASSAALKLDTFAFLWDVVKPRLLKKPWANSED